MYCNNCGTKYPNISRFVINVDAINFLTKPVITENCMRILRSDPKTMSFIHQIKNGLWIYKEENVKKKIKIVLIMILALLVCACSKNDGNKTSSDVSFSAEKKDTQKKDGTTSFDGDSEEDVSKKEDESTKPTNDSEADDSEKNKKKRTDFESNFGDAPFWVQDVNRLYGFIDQSGNYVIEPQFYDIADKYDTFSFGATFVQENGNAPRLWGLIDKTGNYIVEPSFLDAGSFTRDELAYVQDGSGLYGYVDSTGTYQIEPQFTEARSFMDGLAIVSRGYGYEYIDTSGETIIAGNFEEANTFSDDLAAVKQNGLWGFIDHSGDFVIQPIYNEVYSFSEGVAFVSENDAGNFGGYYLIDTEGNYILNEALYKPSENTNNNGGNSAVWTDDLCCVRAYVDDSYPELGFGYAYINKKGEKVLPKDGTYYDYSWGFEKSNDGFYAVATDHASGLYGYIDTKGNWTIPPKYQGGISVETSPYDGKGIIDDSRTLIDMSGNVLAQVNSSLSFFPQRGNYEDVLLAVSHENSSEGKYGFVYPDGNIALDFIYSFSTGFATDGSFAFAQYEGLWGAIDLEGNWLIPAKFLDMQGTHVFIQSVKE